MLSLVIAAAFAQDDGWSVEQLTLPEASLVLRGTATSAEPGDRARLWKFAKQSDFNLMLPGAVMPVVCVKVQDVLYGDYLGEEACFYRSGALSLATEDMNGTGDQIVGKDAVWLLRESDIGGNFLFARDREAYQPASVAEAVKVRVTNTAGRASLAPAAVPSRPMGADAKALGDLLAIHDLAMLGPLRAVMEFGSAQEKIAVIDTVAEYGLLPLIPDVIDHIDDASRITSDADPIGKPLGVYAADAMNRLAPRLDGRTTAERPRDLYGFNAMGIDYELRSVAVEEEWKKWWAEWKVKGPVR